MSVNVSSDQNLEANLIHHEAIESSSSSVPQIKNYKRWFRLSIYVFFVLFFQPLATILGRLYYENGGESTYVVTLLSLVGFPVLILFSFFSQTRQPKSTDTNFNQSPSFTTLASAYMCTGLLMASSYSEKPQEEEETFEDRIEDQPYVKPPPFDIRILTPDQRDELHRLQRMKENRQDKEKPSTTYPDTPH
ncbi:hypothetical protein Bca4012_093389 [Brassica carinata]